MIRTRIDKSQRWLIIKIPLQAPKASKNGNLVIATSKGVKADEATLNGKPIYAIANAWLYPDDPAPTAASTLGITTNSKVLRKGRRKRISPEHLEKTK